MCMIQGSGSTLPPHAYPKPLPSGWGNQVEPTDKLDFIVKDVCGIKGGRRRPQEGPEEG